MKKKIKISELITIIVWSFWTILLLFSLWNVYRYLSQAEKVDQELVKSYSSSLNVKQIKQAAEALQEP